MVIILVPLVVAIIGLLMYVLASKGEVKEIGRLMFACGLLVALFAAGKATVQIGT